MNVYLLGATGSIGLQTLDVIRENKNLFKLKSISVGHNIDKAIEIIQEFNPEFVSVIEEFDKIKLQKLFPNTIIAELPSSIQTHSIHSRTTRNNAEYAQSLLPPLRVHPKNSELVL